MAKVIRENDLDNLTPAFAENCDVKLTDKCNEGCFFCYEGCTSDGQHSDILNQKWIHTLHPYTELAINGNDMDHPQLIPFLQILKEQKVIANITVNQNQFMNNLDKIDSLYKDDLIFGLGVSLITPTKEFIHEIKKYPNAVIHTINGILNRGHIAKLSNNNLKILILGYKELQRGIEYKDKHRPSIYLNQEYLKDNLKNIIDKFDVISFDNLALEQLDVKNSGILTEDAWNEFYMGDDGTVTYFIDAVKKEFAKNSLSQDRYPTTDSVDDMFRFIQENK